MKALSADVVVIGGGVNGCSTAYHLAKSGVKKVVLVEKGHVASGPTGLSSGIVRQYYTLEPLAMMARDSVRVLEHFHDVVGGDAGFVQCGIVFMGGPGDEAGIRESVAMHQHLGIKEQLLTKAEMLAMEPHLNLDGIVCGAYEPEGGYADPALVANSFAEAAKSAGVEILHNTEVIGITTRNGRVSGVSTPYGEITTEKVVNVAGPWGNRVASMVGIDLPITASRHPVLVLERPPSWDGRMIAWTDLVRGWYFKPEGPRGVMIGSLTEVEADCNVNIEGYSMNVTFDETIPYSESAVYRFPVMEDGGMMASWAGLYDVTPDGLPVIGGFDEVEGFYCAVGWNGHGFKTSPALGTLMAELTMTGKCTRYDISIFKHDRFDKGTTRKSKSAYAIIG